MDRALKKMQESDQVVHLLPKADAERLIKSGHVRRTDIDPAPDNGTIACNLTALGRSGGNSPPPPPPPEIGG